MNFAAAVFGESLVDVIRTSGASQARPGGSPLNVAVGLARLGAEVEFATSFGRDDAGRAIAEHLEGAGVAVTTGSLGDAPTSVAEASIDEAGHARYTFDITWDPAVEPQSPAAVAHVGSISAVLVPGAGRVLEWVRSVRATTVVSYDPNIRPSITGGNVRADVDRVAALADIVKVSAEDVHALASSEGELVDGWLSGGCSLVLVTDGENGVRFSTRAGTRTIPAVASSVVDTVGAGDSYMAGLLWSLATASLLDRALLGAASLDEFARHAAFAAGCAAITVGREGADPPSLRDVAARAALP